MRWTISDCTARWGALVADFTAITGTAVHRVSSPGVSGLPRETELVLYRVAQEALTNVARHANASSVELSLTRAGRCVVLSVPDDGIGIPTHVEGTGIQGMRERALLIGGELTLSRTAGGGTHVRLVAPYPKGAHDA